MINAGSSSLKYQLFDTKPKSPGKGLCERIGIDGKVKHNVPGRIYIEEVEMKNHGDAAG